MAQSQRKVVQHWDPADYTPRTQTSAPTAAVTYPRNIPPARKRLPITRLSVAGLALGVVAALAGELPALAGLAAAVVAMLAIVIRGSFWIMDNVHEF